MNNAYELHAQLLHVQLLHVHVRMLICTYIAEHFNYSGNYSDSQMSELEMEFGYSYGQLIQKISM